MDNEHKDIDANNKMYKIRFHIYGFLDCSLSSVHKSTNKRFGFPLFHITIEDYTCLFIRDVYRCYVTKILGIYKDNNQIKNIYWVYYFSSGLKLMLIKLRFLKCKI